MTFLEQSYLSSRSCPEPCLHRLSKPEGTRDVEQYSRSACTVLNDVCDSARYQTSPLTNILQSVRTAWVFAARVALVGNRGRPAASTGRKSARKIKSFYYYRRVISAKTIAELLQLKKPTDKPVEARTTILRKLLVSLGLLPTY